MFAAAPHARQRVANAAMMVVGFMSTWGSVMQQENAIYFLGENSRRRPSALRAARDSNADWMGRLRIFYEGLSKSSALGKYMLGIGKNRNDRRRCGPLNSRATGNSSRSTPPI